VRAHRAASRVAAEAGLDEREQEQSTRWIPCLAAGGGVSISGAKTWARVPRPAWGRGVSGRADTWEAAGPLL